MTCNKPPPKISHALEEIIVTPDRTIIKYRCEEPYVLESASQMECLFGEWKGQLPICKESSCTVPKLDHGDVLEENKGQYYFNLKKLQYIRDVLHIIIPEGKVVSPSTTYLLFCPAGYVVKGTSVDRNEISCSGGKWLPEPVCVPGRCYLNDLKSLENIHEDTPLETNYGYKLNVSCKAGYTANEEIPFCENGTWTKNNISLCKKSDKCYWLGGVKSNDRWSWNVAADRCIAKGGHLVTIKSEEEHDFIVSFLLLNIKTHVWIGLQLRDSEFVWHDGSKSKFRKWIPNEPSGIGPSKVKEDCIEMNFTPQYKIIGEWNDVSCAYRKAYICQANINRRKISPDPKFCSPDVGGGWKFQKSCYHLISEKTTWHHAEDYCKSHFNGGHLVTVLDILVDKFLKYILSHLDEELWIGINIKDRFQQQWSSGWYVGYSGLSDDPRNFEEGYCVARKKFNQWKVVDCSKKLFFVCETSKTKPPVLPEAPYGYHCPEGIQGLRDLGGKNCYFIDTKQQVSWYEASYECLKRGGNLASIHSKEETDILVPIVRYTQHRLFIGLLRSMAKGEDFVWSDGTAMNYENWAYSEPNDVLNEKCGEIFTSTLQWNDIRCKREKGFICAIPKIGSSLIPKTNNNA